MTIKEKVLNAVTELPQNVDFEEILERLYFLYKVETGLQQVQAGDTLTHSHQFISSPRFPTSSSLSKGRFQVTKEVGDLYIQPIGESQQEQCK